MGIPLCVRHLCWPSPVSSYTTHTQCRRHGLPCEALALARCRWHEQDPAFVGLLERIAAAAAATTASDATPAAPSRLEAPAVTQQSQPHTAQQQEQQHEQQVDQGPLGHLSVQHTSLVQGGSGSQVIAVIEGPHSVGGQVPGGYEQRGNVVSPAEDGGRAAEPSGATTVRGSPLELSPTEQAPQGVTMAAGPGESAPAGSSASGLPPAPAHSPRSTAQDRPSTGGGSGGGSGAATAAAAPLSAPIRSPSAESLALQLLVAGRPLAAAQALRAAALSRGSGTSARRGQGLGLSAGGSAGGEAQGGATVAWVEVEKLAAMELALQRLVTAAELCARAAVATAVPQVGCMAAAPSMHAGACVGLVF